MKRNHQMNYYKTEFISSIICSTFSFIATIIIDKIKGSPWQYYVPGEPNLNLIDRLLYNIGIYFGVLYLQFLTGTIATIILRQHIKVKDYFICALLFGIIAIIILFAYMTIGDAILHYGYS